LADIDKRLATEGLKRDPSVKPFAERSDIDTTMAKINLPIVQGASALLGLPGMVAEGLQSGAELIGRGLGYTPEQVAASRPIISAPTPASLTRAAGEYIPLQRAESFPGQLAQTVVRNIASAPVAGAVVPSLLSAAGEETLAIPFKGTDLEPYARAVGGIATPLALAPFAVKSPLERMYAESTQRMTPEQIQAASQLQRQSFQAGMPVTSFEAMQQAAGGRTTLPALQRQIEGVPASAPQMAEFMAERGAATQRTLQEQFPQTTRAQLGTEMQAQFLGTYFVAAAFSMPLWLRLIARFGLSTCWAGGMALAIAVFIWSLALGAGDVWYGHEWIPTNIEELNVYDAQDWEFLFGDKKMGFVSTINESDATNSCANK
jgi:hypothetical protein